MSFLIGACSYELELPVSSDLGVNADFGISDAQRYFEQNATDLSPLNFAHEVKTRAEHLTQLELFPVWKQAVRSGHRGVSLVEVPILSNSVYWSRELHFKNGKPVYKKFQQISRRLIVARRSTGETDMFVITIVPSSTFKGNVAKSMENFRYLGGGDFTGNVFCSTLEGEYVKAFGYKDGKMMGTLTVMRRSQLAEHSVEDSLEEYSSFRIDEYLPQAAETYAFYEGGSSGGGGGGGTTGGNTGSSNTCPHGYSGNTCPICLEEVVVTACPYCKTTGGCTCPKCFYCGKKEPECGCTICTRCKHKMPECTCYTYPNPDPDPDPIPGGGTGSGDSDKFFSPEGELSKAIFNNDSKLTKEQWDKVEKALENINKDCLGGRLIGELEKQGIKLVYCDTLKANGSYSHKKKELKVKKFYESDLSERLFERTLLHELIHSRQSGDVNSAINQEIEVRIADRHYAQKYKINYSVKHKAYIESILSQLDIKYRIQDITLYNEAYNNYVEFLKTDVDYQKYKESPLARDLSTIQRLAKDC